MVDITTANTYVIFPCVGFIFHGTTLWLLRKKHVNSTINQKIILLNLSSVEISICCCDFTRWAVYCSIGSSNLAYESAVTVFYCFLLTYLCIMITLTIDRFAQIYLNIRYDLYWSVRKTKYLMKFLWICTFLLASILLFLVNLKLERSQMVTKMFGVWIVPPAFSLFLLIVVFTYIYIAKKIIQTRRFDKRFSVRSRSSHASSGTKLPNRVKTQSGLRIRDVLTPTLLILTYILFVMVPVFVLYLAKRKIIPATFQQLRNPLLYIGCFADAIICILLSTTVGKKLTSRNPKRNKEVQNVYVCQH